MGPGGVITEPYISCLHQLTLQRMLNDVPLAASSFFCYTNLGTNVANEIMHQHPRITTVALKVI